MPSRARMRQHTLRQWSEKGFALLAQLGAVPDCETAIQVALSGTRDILRSARSIVLWLDMHGQPSVTTHPAPDMFSAVLLEPRSPITTAVRESKRPLLIPDLTQPLPSLELVAHPNVSGALLAVPVFIGDDVGGILAAVDVRPRIWQTEEVALLEAIGAQLTNALQRHRLRNELKRRADELATVYDTAITISANLDLSTTLHTIVEQAARVAHANGAGLYLHHEHQAELEVVVSYQLDRDYRGQRIKVGEGLSGRATLSKQIERVNDYRSWPHRAARFAGAPFYAVLAVPLIQDGHVLGVIDLLHTEPDRYFTDNDVAVVQLFAAQAAVAIANARLYNAASIQAQRMTELAQASQLLDAQGDLATTVKPLATQGMHVLRAQACIVTLCGVPERDAIHIVGKTESEVAALQASSAFRCNCDDPSPSQAAALGHALAANPAEQEAVEAAGFATALTLPLLRDDQRVGCVTFLYSAAHSWDQGEGEIARVIANQLAALVTNAQLYYEAHEANRLKSEFIATVSHELRTPMGAIMGYAELLTSGSYGVLPGSMHDPLNRLRTNADNLLLLINQMLDLSRIEAGRLELRMEPLQPHDLLNAVAAAAQPQTFGKAVIFDYAVSPAVPNIVMGDVARLRQILINLVENSLKFTTRGTVTLQCSAVRDSPQPELIFEVTDTGPGIAPETLAVIWRPFRQGNSSETREHSGVGLGLTIVHKLVELMGGTATVKSELGVGSTFSIHLPLLLPGA